MAERYYVKFVAENVVGADGTTKSFEVGVELGCDPKMVAAIAAADSTTILNEIRPGLDVLHENVNRFKTVDSFEDIAKAVSF